MEEEGQKVIEQMEKRGLIRPSKSPWASNVTLVRKPNGKIHITIDYRGLNAVTQVPVSNQPKTQDCIDALAMVKYFSLGDSSAAYHQIRMKEEDIPKTAFITKFGLYEWVTLPMGLSGAPFCYTRLMELALAGLQWNTCVIYLDDVIIFGKTFEEHLSQLAEVLERFRSAGLKLKPEKCQFFQKEVKFLGYLLSAEGVKPHPDNIEKIQNWPMPQTPTDVRALLGMGNYYRRFIRGYSEKVAPLVELTKQDVPFQWTKVCQERFDQLKEELAGCDIVAHPQDDGQFILDTDASGTTIGCVLSQVQDGKEKVIAYGSRTLSRTERNYCVTDRELLAVRFFMEYYRQYLLGRKFIVRTDHQALKWLFSLKEPKDRIARWLEIMSAYQFVVEYRPGKKHGNADAMSRRQCNPSECKCPVLDGDEEILKCGPCGKCRKRADTMDSSLMDEEGKVRDQNMDLVGNNNEKPKSMRSQGTQTELSPAQSDSGRISKLPKKKKHG